MTSGRTKPAVATLYRTLERLVANGLIEEADTGVVDGRFRRTYRLTGSGADALAAEAAVRASTARLASKRLGRAGEGSKIQLAGGQA
jgi:DNA-binding PadR family transcriptional regulator